MLTSTPISKLFTSLVGSWRLNRIIPSKGAVTGVAKIAPMTPSKLHYHETGKMRLAGIPTEMEMERSYYYVYTDHDDRIRVYFDAELSQLFQELAFNETLTTATTSHLCIKDTYDAQYDFNLLPNSFSIRYKIDGPAKDYGIETSYERMESQTSFSSPQ